MFSSSAKSSAGVLFQAFIATTVLLQGEIDGSKSSVLASHFYNAKVQKQPTRTFEEDQIRISAPWEDEEDSIDWLLNKDADEEDDEAQDEEDKEEEVEVRPRKFRHRRSQQKVTEKAKSKNKRSVSIRLKEKKILDQVLGKEGSKYDKRIRPAGVNSTDEKSSTIVNVNIYLRSINDIDDYKMEFSVQITFREQWNDERLKFDDLGGKLKYLTLTDPGKVWMPDTFFRNEKVGHFHAILVNNVYVRIFPNGDVLYSIRISLTLACPMNLKLYPMDRQTCSLKIASYGYTTDDITYMWERKDPVQIPKGMSLPRFSIEKYSSDYCNVKTNTGEYSCLTVDLVFKRQFSYYLITIYVPGCMLVIVSWVSFWLDPHAVPARVALGVTTLLTMSTQTASINSALPPVAYTKAIDVWQGVCVTFVFSALLEYALVNYALRANRTYFRLRGIDFRRGFNDDGDEDDDDDDNDFDHGASKQQLFDQEVGMNRRKGSLFKRTFGKRNGSASFGQPQQQHRDSDASFPRHDSQNLLFASLGAANRGLGSLGGGASLSPPSKRPSSPHPAATLQRQESKLSNAGSSVLAKLFQPFNPNIIPSKTSMGKPSRSALINSYVYSMERAKRIDVVSRVVFPAVFAVFNLSYWIYYLIRAAKEFDDSQN